MSDRQHHQGCGDSGSESSGDECGKKHGKGQGKGKGKGQGQGQCQGQGQGQGHGHGHGHGHGPGPGQGQGGQHGKKGCEQQKGKKC